MADISSSSSPSSSSTTPLASTSSSHHNEPALVDDLIAGWLGGAIGILASNPFEVLKVRMQTAVHPGAHPDTPSTPRAGAGSRPPSSTRAGLILLWKTEGARFLVAGAAAPILGLAFIDSAFFALYGRTMSVLEQDRKDPASLMRVFASGATAGGVCALLQTPIEVVKCRAQVENQASSKALGSLGITKLIARQEGIKGFYHGGLTTAMRDTLSSGIFFSTYIMFRRALRFEYPFQAAAPIRSDQQHQQSHLEESITPIPEIIGVGDGPQAPSYTIEVLQTLAAGGLAGSLSAIIPYPLDIIKTRLQTVHCQPAPTMSSVARQIWLSGAQSYIYQYPTTLTHALLRSLTRLKRTWHPGERSQFLQHWSTRVLGLRNFLVGYRPTVASSFIGSAATITVVEVTLAALQRWRDR